MDILGLDEVRESVVTSVESFNTVLDRGEAGMNVSVLLRGIDRADIQRGQVIAAPRSIRQQVRFKG